MPTSDRGTFSAGYDRRRCRLCGTLKTLHEPTTLACPEHYRPTTLSEARRELMLAEQSHDSARIFVARGDVQRLERGSSNAD